MILQIQKSQFSTTPLNEKKGQKAMLIRYPAQEQSIKKTNIKIIKAIQNGDKQLLNKKKLFCFGMTFLHAQAQLSILFMLCKVYQKANRKKWLSSQSCHFVKKNIGIKLLHANVQ